MAKTPNGINCNAFGIDSKIHNTLSKAVKGSWQEKVLENLMRDGYIVGYLATGKLRGKAKKYQGHYAESLSHLMDRIENILNEETPYKLERDNIGEKGAWGYYITT